MVTAYRDGKLSFVPVVLKLHTYEEYVELLKILEEAQKSCRFGRSLCAEAARKFEEVLLEFSL